MLARPCHRPWLRQTRLPRPQSRVWPDTKLDASARYAKRTGTSQIRASSAGNRRTKPKWHARTTNRRNRRRRYALLRDRFALLATFVPVGFDRFDELAGHVWIELTAGAALDLGHRDRVRHRPPICTVARHRIVRIRDRDDARDQRDACRT